MFQNLVKAWEVTHQQDLRATGGGTAQAPVFEEQTAAWRTFYDIFVVRFGDESVHGIAGLQQMETPTTGVS